MSFFKKAEPLLVRNLPRNFKYSPVMKQLHELNLSQTLNTEVACRVCRGTRINYVKNSAGIISCNHCFNCGGTGTMLNGDGQ